VRTDICLFSMLCCFHVDFIGENGTDKKRNNNFVTEGT